MAGHDDKNVSRMAVILMPHGWCVRVLASEDFSSAAAIAAFGAVMKRSNPVATL
jgi:hypothetical protein